MQTKSYDYLFKILLIGDSSTGKSSMLLRFADDEFSSDLGPTIGVDFKIRTMTIDGKVGKLQIWDTAGQERFRTITESYYKGAQGVVVVYDVSNPVSFKHVARWMEDVAKFTKPDAQVILAGNKTDLPRRVSAAEARRFAEKLGVGYIETSAKTDTNITELFEAMGRKLRKQLHSDDVLNRPQDKNLLHLQNPPPPVGGGGTTKIHTSSSSSSQEEHPTTTMMSRTTMPCGCSRRTHQSKIS